MRLTIFTPTYNRRQLLKRTYESLKRQSVKDFEWLIVDDGSTDNTKEQVEKWIREGKLTIRYHYRQNGGKMRAHNFGAKIASAPLFLCLDSDDYLTDTAVEDMLSAYENAGGSYGTSDEEVLEMIEGDDSDGKILGGVVAHKGKSDIELLGSSQFPNVERSSLYNLYLNGFAGETTLMYETRFFRCFPFPEIEGEKYVPEDYIYDKIDSVCELVVLPKIITVCEIVNEGYTDSVLKLKKNNPIAWYLYYEQRSYITPQSVLRIKYLGRYVIYAIRSKKGLSDSKRLTLFDKMQGILFAAFLLIIRKE